MMKKILFSILLLLPFISFSQILDTAAVKNQADTLISGAYNLLLKSDLQKAWEKAEKADSLIQNYLSPAYKKYTTSFHLRGLIKREMGEYESAERFFLQAEKAHALTHFERIEYMETLVALGDTYQFLGRYDLSETTYLKAKQKQEELRGKENPYYAYILNGLGWLYSETGQNKAAESAYLEVMEIGEKIFDKEDPNFAGLQFNLGSFYMQLGRLTEAEKYYVQAKEVWTKKFGKDHRYYAMSSGNLGIVYSRRGQYSEAEAHHLEALKFWEDKLKYSAEHVRELTNLGSLYRKKGDYERADSLFRATLDILENHNKARNYLYVRTLNDLGLLQMHLNNFEVAATFYLSAKSTIEEIYGDQYSLYPEVMSNLGRLYWKIQDFTKADSFLLSANNISRQQLIKATRYLSEQELSKYNRLFLNDFHELHALAHARGERSPQLLSSCYDNTLFQKGFLLYSSVQTKNLTQTDPTTTEKYHLLQSYYRLLAKEYTKPIASRQKVEALEEKANILEKELVRTVAGFGETRRQVNWQEVQAKLKPGEAAIEFVHYRYTDPEPTDSTFYAALVLRPGDQSPHFVPLFEEKKLQYLLEQDFDTRRSYLANLYNPPSKKTPTSLQELIWQPLEKLLQKSHILYIAPSGLLHRINLGAVMINKRFARNDRHRVITLGSTRQLATGKQKAENQPLTAQLYGGIQYEMDSLAIREVMLTNDETTLTRENDENFSFQAERSERGLSWDDLPGSGLEVDMAGALLKQFSGTPNILKGYAATEESFKQIGQHQPSPRLLHIATHGFFQPDPEEVDRLQPGFDQMPAFKISDHPMIRSGLVFAGGNHVWRGKSAIAGMEDGILTAYEASQVNLGNTELVVLSACETGLGDIDGNEGVYGLQRAFKIAGAHYLLMSLWPVPDEQTQELMVAFYRNWLEKKMTIPNAFSAAQEGMRKKYKEHYYWAAFVLLE